jgi:hypothetical protein
MNGSEQNLYSSGISPILSAATSTRSGLPSDTSFNSFRQAGPYTSYENSPFIGPETDAQYSRIGQNIWERGYMPSDGSVLSPVPPHLQSHNRLHNSWNNLPSYYDHLDSPNFTKTSFGSNSQPPPYHLDNSAGHIGTDSFVNQNGYQTSGSCLRTQIQQTIPTGTHIVQRKIVPEATVLQASSKRVAGSRSANDRRYRAAQDKSISGNKSTLLNHDSPQPPWSELVEISLKQLYPNCQTYGECVTNFTQDSVPWLRDQNLRNSSSSPRAVVSNTDTKNSTDKWSQIGPLPTRTKSSSIMVSSEPPDTNSDGSSDGEIESEEENESDLDDNIDAMVECEIDHRTDIFSGAISYQPNVEAPPSNSDTVLPGTNRQSSNNTTPKRRLGCPYYQRNPTKYQNNRACSGPGWYKVHRIK